MHERLDIESQRRTDAHYILAVKFLENGRLARVVQTTGHILSLLINHELRALSGLQEKNAHFFFFLSVLPDNRKEAHDVLFVRVQQKAEQVKGKSKRRFMYIAYVHKLLEFYFGMGTSA
jgi:hypothetical protein